MKSLRIFEEKKQKEKQRGNCTDHTYYLLGFHARKKNYTTNYFMHTAKPLLHLQKKLNIKG